MRLQSAWAAALLLLSSGIAAHAQPSTIKLIVESEPTVLDPVVNTIAVEQQHGYMIYDNLYGLDANGVPQPQMVDHDVVGGDGRVQTFTLRPDLKFHDGTPVRAADAVASIKRWAARDTSVGAKLREMGLTIETIDDHNFRITTTQPTPLVLIGLAKIATPALFVMREQDAMNEPTKAVTSRIGSGPFRFVASEYRPGDRLVYERNPNYVPRDEPPSYYAGGRKVNVDRVEFRVIPDPATAAAALRTGEVDIYDSPPLDLVPSLRQAPGVVVRPLDHAGAMAIMRVNHLHKPFTDPRARQAMLLAVDQTQFMPAVGGDEPGGWRVCYSFLGCAGPKTTEAGMDAYRKVNIAEAKRLLAESGYHGEPILLMDPSDNPIIGPLAEISAQSLRAAGFNIDLRTMDWATMLQRRSKTVSAAEGGWDIFLTWVFNFDLRSPATNFLLAAPCTTNGWFGWACDPEMDRLRGAWAQEPDDTKRWALVEQLQTEAAKSVPYVPLGEFLKQVAFRRSLSGLMEVPITVFWNVRKQ